MSASKAAVPGRVRWALEVLDPRPAEPILEIGSGPGVAAGPAPPCYDSGGPRAAERLCAPIEATMRRHGFVDVAVRTSDQGVSISGRTHR